MSKALDAAAIAIAWGEPCDPFAPGPLCRWEHRTQAYRNACIDKARAAIAAFLAAETEWVLVPVTPTPSMVLGAMAACSLYEAGEVSAQVVTNSALKAAISAAPEYPLEETP